MRGQRGQGTVEYVGVIFLVAVVIALAASTALGAGPREIWSAVRHEIHRALCIVTGGDCYQDRAPCPVVTDNARAGAGISVWFARLGKHHMLVKEVRSDGTVAITLLEEYEGGAEAASGAKAELTFGSSRLAVGGESRAALLARLGRGSTWIVHHGAEANALEHRVREHFITGALEGPLSHLVLQKILPRLPPPDETFGEVGIQASGEVETARRMATLGVDLSAADTFGSRVEVASGRRTYFVKRRNELAGSLGATGGEVAGSGGHSTEYAVTVDGTGRPIDLAVTESGDLRGTLDLSARVREVEGALNVASVGNRTWVSESHLDLTDPDNLAVAREVIDQLRSPRRRVGAVVTVSRALEKRLEEDAVINARTYERTPESYGARVSGGVEGVRAAVDAGVEMETARLIAARTRGIDGEWQAREDCEGPGA